jgi:predicted molibdopterin-dependent oxidoreductase YjgC
MTKARKNQARVGSMKHNYSICPHCGCGCGLYLVDQDGEKGGVTASQNHYLGKGQLCSRGWTSYQLLTSDKRISEPSVRNGQGLTAVSWDKALETAAKKLKAVKDKHGDNSIGVIVSGRLTNQEAGAVKVFAQSVLETQNYDSSARLCMIPVAFPNQADTKKIDTADIVLVIGANLLEDNPILGQRILSRCKPENDRPYVSPDLTHVVPESPARLIILDSQKNQLSKHASLFLWSRPGREGHVLTALLKQLIEKHNAQSTDPEFRKLKENLSKLSPGQLIDGSGVNHVDLETAAREISSAKNPILIFGKNLLHQPEAFEAWTALSDISILLKDRLSVLPITNGANDYGTGRILNSPDGLSYMEIIEAAGKKRIRGLVLIGEDPLKVLPGKTAVEKALGQLEALIIIDSYPNDCNAMAEAVLPWKLSFEKTGSFYNLDGKKQDFATINDSGNGKRDLEVILMSLTEVIGGRMETNDKLPETETVKLDPFKVIEIESEALPFNLELGSVYPHLYGDDGQTFNTYHLARESTGGYIELHPEDIADLGLRSGWKAKVVSETGSVVTVIKANPNIYKKTAFMPIHFGGNVLAPFQYDAKLKTPVLKGIPIRIEKI